MDFRTEIKIPVSSSLISHRSAILCLGSCFSNNIGTMLKEDKFDTLINPFGTIYNPYSIAHLLSKSITEPIQSEIGLIHINGRYVHQDYHGELSDLNKEGLIERINSQLRLTFEYLKKATHIFITLGSAFVFEDIESDRIVANCHKIPAKRFRRRIMAYHEIMQCLRNLVGSIKVINPSAVVTFTVSPVRHLRDGLINNSRSKSILISVSQQIAEECENVDYFPSYECVIDDLRDYRFYEEDMMHPNEIAIKYIYQKLEQCYFNESTQRLNQAIRRIKRATNHRPIHPQSADHQSFVTNLFKQIEELEKDAKLDFSIEKEKLRLSVSS